MKERGYNLRQRPLLVLVSDQSSLPISTIASIEIQTPTMASHGQENLGSDSVQGIDIVAEPVDPAATSSGDQSNVLNVATTAPNVEFTQNVQQQAASVNVLYLMELMVYLIMFICVFTMFIGEFLAQLINF